MSKNECQNRKNRLVFLDEKKCHVVARATKGTPVQNVQIVRNEATCSNVWLAEKFLGFHLIAFFVLLIYDDFNLVLCIHCIVF